MTYCNLFVAKLPRIVTDADLEHIFADYNPISAKVMLEASTGKSKGFGFVLFNTEEEGKKAYKELNRKTVRACRQNFDLMIYPSQHSGKVAATPSTALYIRNIPITVPQKQVEEFLATFGALSYCAMREDHYGNPVWVVYVEYDSLEHSKKALQTLHGSSKYFDGPPVMVKYADSEEAKRERRRRREEGKIAFAPFPRSSCVFPPRQPIPHGKEDRRPSSSSDIVLTVSSSSSSSTNSAAYPRGTAAPSQDSTTCSIGFNQNSDSSSTTSSIHKVLDGVFAPPPLSQISNKLSPSVFLAPRPEQMPPLYPMACPIPSITHQTGGAMDNSSTVILLKNGQQFLLASDAVNLPASNLVPFPRNDLLWLPVDMMQAPQATSHPLAFGFFP